MDVRIGLVGIIGIWLTMAVMPLAELLPLNAYQLLVLRGLPGALLIVFVFARKGSLQWPDANLMYATVTFLAACSGLFRPSKSGAPI